MVDRAWIMLQNLLSCRNRQRNRENEIMEKIICSNCSLDYNIPSVDATGCTVKEATFYCPACGHGYTFKLLKYESPKLVDCYYDKNHQVDIGLVRVGSIYYIGIAQTLMNCELRGTASFETSSLELAYNELMRLHKKMLRVWEIKKKDEKKEI